MWLSGTLVIWHWFFPEKAIHINFTGWSLCMFLNWRRNIWILLRIVVLMWLWILSIVCIIAAVRRKIIIVIVWCSLACWFFKLRLAVIIWRINRIWIIVLWKGECVMVLMRVRLPDLTFRCNSGLLGHEGRSSDWTLGCFIFRNSIVVWVAFDDHFFPSFFSDVFQNIEVNLPSQGMLDLGI